VQQHVRKMSFLWCSCQPLLNLRHVHTVSRNPMTQRCPPPPPPPPPHPRPQPPSDLESCEHVWGKPGQRGGPPPPPFSCSTAVHDSSACRTSAMVPCGELKETGLVLIASKKHRCSMWTSPHIERYGPATRKHRTGKSSISVSPPVFSTLVFCIFFFFFWAITFLAESIRVGAAGGEEEGGQGRGERGIGTCAGAGFVAGGTALAGWVEVASIGFKFASASARASSQCCCKSADAHSNSQTLSGALPTGSLERSINPTVAFFSTDSPPCSATSPAHQSVAANVSCLPGNTLALKP